MPFTNYGLLQVGSFIGGFNPSSPTHLEFGTGSATFIGSVNELETPIIRKPITWTWAGDNIRANAQLSTIDAVGSTIRELGVGVGSAVGGANLYSRDLSAIGDKTESFSVDIKVEYRITRP